MIGRIPALLTTLLLAASAVAVWAQTSADEQTLPPPPARPEAPASETLDTEHAKMKKLFAWMHHLNELEAELGELAHQKAFSRTVRAYGDLVARDHRRADTLVRDMARKMRIRLGALIPETQEEKQELRMRMQVREKLQAALGEEFDRAYLRAMLEEHAKAIRFLTRARDSTGNGDVRELLSRIIPILEQHHALAERLAAKPGRE